MIAAFFALKEELSDLLKDKRANGESGAEEEEGFLISKSKTDPYVSRIYVY